MASTSQGPPALNYVISGGQWVPWDGAITVPPITIGTVDQGAAGLDPWLVTVTNPGGGETFGDPFPATGVAAGYKDASNNLAPVVLDAGGRLPVQLPPNAAEETGGNLETTATQTTAAATVLGTTTDATVQGNNTGTINARLRGISVVLNDVWDSVSHFLKVNIQNATLAVTQSGSWVLSAGANLIGRVSASNETSTIYNGTTALTPKFAVIAASSSGNNTIVAAVTSKKLRVLAYNFIANGTVNAKFQTAAGGTDLTGLKYCVANTGICAPFNPAGWFETASGDLLNLNLSAAVAVGGELVYVEV